MNIVNAILVMVKLEIVAINLHALSECSAVLVMTGIYSIPAFMTESVKCADLGNEFTTHVIMFNL